MKLLINIVILIVVISSVCAVPKSRWMTNRGKKIKRGIYGEGFIGGGGVHGLSFGIPAASGFSLPFAFQHKPYVPSVYSKFPGAPFALAHGDASVQSFQINYPKYNYVQPKPIIAQPAPFPIAAPFTPQIQFAAAQYPQIFQGFAGVAAPVQHVHHGVGPAPAPSTPTIGTPTPITPVVSHAPGLSVAAAAPTFFFHQKPIVPVAIPAPAVLPKPIVFTKPVPQNPIFTIAALTPQFVSIPYPTEAPTENPSTVTSTASTMPTNEPPPSTQQPNPDGQSGTNFVTNVNPDQQSWQPMFIGSTNHFLPTPTSPTGQNVPRPPISLLPPYLGPTGPGYDSNTFFITSTNIPVGNNNNNDNSEQQPNQSENNFNNIQPTNNANGNNNGNEFGQGGFEIQQSHNMNNNNNNNNNYNNNNNHPSNHHGSHSHNHNRNHHNVNQQGYGPFNGQGYDAPSNSGRYIGPSSYQVGLRTRIN